MKKVLVGILVLSLVGGGVYVFAIRDTSEPASDGHTDHTHSEETSSSSSSPESADVVIIYTNSGFNPTNYTVKSGGTVTVQNDSNSVLDFASNDHPAHTDNSEMNIGEITSGTSATFMPKTAGTWGFHNHENDLHSGTLVVE